MQITFGILMLLSAGIFAGTSIIGNNELTTQDVNANNNDAIISQVMISPFMSGASCDMTSTQSVCERYSACEWVDGKCQQA